MEIPPEVSEIVRQLLAKPFVHEMNPSRVVSELSAAKEYRGCNIAFWRTPTTRYMFIFRTDRFPNNNEVMPWLQELFVDGQVHESSDPKTPFRAFFQGDVYSVDSAMNMLAEGVANAADKQDSRLEAFDFENTELGKKLIRQERSNGTG